MSNRIILDWESTSRADLKELGSWRYSQHSSTRILTFGYKVILDPWHPGYGLYPSERVVCKPGDKVPSWVKDRLWEQGVFIEAHNSLFEQSLWHNICHLRWKWPAVPPKYWACTAARAAMCALPRALGKVGEVLKLPVVKSEDGAKIMKQLMRPRGERSPVAGPYPGEHEGLTKARKAYNLWLKAFEANKFKGEYEMDPDGTIVRWYTPETEPEKFAILYDYVGTDVDAEEALGDVLPELPEAEREVWLLDQTINLRGVPIDIPSVDLALKVLGDYEGQLNHEVVTLTGGFIETTGQRDKLLEWLASKDVILENAQAETIDTLLASGTVLPADCRRVLEIRRSLGRAATKKLYAMKARTSEDGRARVNLMYHGASSGRWSAYGLQLQNLLRPTIKDFSNEEAFELLKQGSWKTLADRYGDPMEAIACMSRGFIKAPDGYEFLDADYANIEGRILAWLAGEEWKVKAFREYDEGLGPDLYRLSYARAFGIHIDDVTKENRSIGKVMELALGYAGGVGAFQTMAETYGVRVDDDVADDLKVLWRKRHPAVVAYWKETEACAIEALLTGRKIDCGLVTWHMKGDFLTCQLPSGRLLYYYDPQLETTETPWGAVRNQLTHMGVDAKTKQWVRERTYSGKLVENICQAIARDIMANGMLKAEAAGYPIIVTIHDEVLAEVPKNSGKTLAEFEKLLCDLPAWADGLPIVASGWVGPRYQKEQ